MKRRTFCASTVWPLALLASRHVSAKVDYPSGPIRLIIPYTPGGGVDIVVRPLIAKLSAAFGQSIIPNYRPGADTMIGTQQLAKAEPDGYTIGLITDAHSANPLIYKSVPYDSFADFAPVSQLVDVAYGLVAHSSLSVKTVPELVQYAKANPGKLTYSSSGIGSPQHFVMEWFANIAGIELLHVPYAGGAPAFTAVLGNHVQLTCTGVSTALQYLNDKRLNVLAVTSRSRLAVAPQLPTIAELGYPNFAMSAWFGILAPAKTPPEIVLKLSQEIGRALRSSDLSEKFTALGVVVAPSTPEEFTALLRRSAAFYEQVVKTAHIKLEKH